MARCSLCPGVNNCLEPDGPEDADVLFVGEAPGINENRRKKVFIGKTGQEVDEHYLPLAGLRRDSVRIANAIRCLPTSAGGKLDPSRTRDVELLESCAATGIHRDIENGHYSVLVPMGSFACRAISPAIDLELHHGIPQPTRWGIPAFPMYHPALGIHEPKKMLHIRTDWWKLKRFLNGTLYQPHDDYPSPDYQEVTHEKELATLDPTQPLACDTESKRGGEPFCFTYSQDMGTGRLIRAGRVDLLSVLGGRLQKWEAPILFHNWLYDAPVVGQMGLLVPLGRVVDTMVRVYHLGNLPQGLKALALRECGMEMQDFDDLVSPYSAQLVMDYYERAAAVEWPKPEPQLVRGDEGKWKLYKPQSMNTKLKRFFTDYSKNPLKDPFKMWEENWEDEQGMMEAELGPWPGKCISHVPFAEALHYACRDADALIRLWPILKRMSRLVRRVSQEHWRDT